MLSIKINLKLYINFNIARESSSFMKISYIIKCTQENVK